MLLLAEVLYAVTLRNDRARRAISLGETIKWRGEAGIERRGNLTSASMHQCQKRLGIINI